VRREERSEKKPEELGRNVQVQNHGVCRGLSRKFSSAAKPRRWVSGGEGRFCLDWCKLELQLSYNILKSTGPIYTRDELSV